MYLYISDCHHSFTLLIIMENLRVSHATLLSTCDISIRSVIVDSGRTCISNPVEVFHL